MLLVHEITKLEESVPDFVLLIPGIGCEVFEKREDLRRRLLACSLYCRLVDVGGAAKVTLPDQWHGLPDKAP